MGIIGIIRIIHRMVWGNFLRLRQWFSNSWLFHNIFCYLLFSHMNIGGILLWTQVTNCIGKFSGFKFRLTFSTAPHLFMQGVAVLFFCRKLSHNVANLRKYSNFKMWLDFFFLLWGWRIVLKKVLFDNV